MSDIKNIHQRLNAVRKEVAYLRKEKKVESYMAVTHDQVTREVRDWFVAHGVSIVPTLQVERTVDTGSKTKSGTPIIRFECIYDIAFVNIDDPKDNVLVTVAAHANDQGDKAPGKALSYAVKSAILKILMIETGENDESRSIDEVSAQDIVGFEERMTAAASKDELRTILQEAVAEAKSCNDSYAAKRFRAHAERQAAKFNEFMPGEKKAPDTVVEGDAVAAAGDTGQPAEDERPESVAPQAPSKPRPEVKLATPGMAATVKKAMERTGKTEDQLFEKFRFGSSAIPADQINAVISWAKA